jgi:uncharacterized delta-60 repeat protein
MSTVQNIRNTTLSGLNFFLDPANPKSIPVIPSINLMVQSQNFTSANWLKVRSSVTASATTAPDGSLTGTKLINDISNDSHYVRSDGYTFSSGDTYTISYYAKSSELSWVAIQINENSVIFPTTYTNLSGGSLGNIGAGVTASIENVGDGWYRTSLTRTVVNAGLSYFAILTSTGNGIPSYSGNGTSGVFIWGVQLERLPFSTPYIPTTTTSASRSTVYDLSNSSNTCNLANGTLYNSSNVGNFLFDATDDYINLTNYFSATTWSVNYFTKFNISKIKTTQQGVLNRNSVVNSDGRLLLELTYVSNVNQILLDSSGNIFISGWFVEYNGVERQFIVKLTSTGSLIPEFNAGLSINQTQLVTCIGFNSSGDLLYGGYNLGNLRRINSTTGTLQQTIATVNATIIQSKFIIDNANDKIYVGGWFTSIQGTNAQRLARLNLSAMTIDTSFNTTTGFVNDEDVQDMILQPDGKLIVLGRFTSYKGVSINRIVRLNSDASIDPTFQTSGATFGFNGNISRNCTVLQSDGKVIVGGAFTTYSGVTRNRIIRLNSDGTIDNTFTIGSGFNSDVTCVALQSDGKILVGGSFGTYSGITSSDRIIRLNSNGTKDTTFTASTNSTVTSITIQNDGKILIGGGSITQVNSVNVNQVCRLNTNGSIDNTFSAGTGILGAYRFNCQINYSSAVSTITQQIFYGYKTATDWRKYEVIGDLLSNKWFNMCVTKSTGNTISVYYDGTLYQSATPSTVFSTNNITNRIGPANGNVGVIQYYNRELSSVEVLNNYRSFKDRYQIT